MNRRQWLRTSLGSALALPILPSLARGQASSPPPRRLVIFATALGSYPERFWPRPLGTPAWAPTARPSDHYTTGRTALDTTEFKLEPIAEALSAHKSQMLFIEGIYPQNCNGHAGYSDYLTAATPPDHERGLIGGGISFDQHVARHIAGPTRYPSLQLGVRAGGGKYGALSFYGPNRPALAESDPRVLFDRVFMGVSSGTGEDPQIARLRRERKSVLDAALAQANALYRRASAPDREKLEQYLDSFRQLEQRLAAPPGAASCARPPAPRPSPDEEFAQSEFIPEMSGYQIENLAMAFACDLTRVATFQIGFEGANGTHPWLGINSRHHDLSHTDYDSPDAVERYDEIQRINVWQAQQLDKLVTRLKGINEGNGSVFDSTMIVWINTLTTGASHDNNNAPLLVLGSGGSNLRLGRHVRFAEAATRPSLHDLWVTLGRVLGVDMTGFGEDKYKRLGHLSVIAA